MENQSELDLSNNNSNLKKSSILILSNGHGEDLVASKIVSCIYNLFPDINVKVYPLVGLGEIFFTPEYKGNLTILNPRKVMPSGGFCMQSIKSFFNDINHGLIDLILNQYKVVKYHHKNTDLIIAVGDSYPLILSWLSGSNFAYIQTKKSDYSWINNKLSINNLFNTLKGTEWNLLEILFCRSRRSKLVATRDEVSSNNLRKWKINAITANPMLAKLTKKSPPTVLKEYERLIILPGSRIPELNHNFKRMLKIIKRLNNRSRKMIFLCPLTSKDSIDHLGKYLSDLGFLSFEFSDNSLNIHSAYTLNNGQSIIAFGYKTFIDWVGYCKVGITSAGTSTEQLSGLGIPSVSIIGKGPQFIKTFAIRQERVLGGCVQVSLNTKMATRKVNKILDDKNLRTLLGSIGKHRMRQGGGAPLLAREINKTINRL